MSAEPTTEVVVRKTLTVPIGPERAFELFTARMTEFWPPDHRLGDAAIAEVVVEPRPGGRWFERGIDGVEHPWGRVAAWEPPGRVVLVWQLDTEWNFDPALETELEVTFVEDSPGRTRLDLLHRHLERFGGEAEEMRAVFDSPTGWTGILGRYVDACG